MWLLIGCWKKQVPTIAGYEEEHKAILGLFDDIGEAVAVRQGLGNNPNNPYDSYWIQEVPVKTPVKIVIQ